MVLDPVMVAKGGAPLLEADAVGALRDRLLPLATLVTPNLPEAERLWGAPLRSARGPAALCRGARTRAGRCCSRGATGSGEEIEDLLAAAGTVHRFRHPRLATRSTHGTGCTLSAAIAARLAAGAPLVEAVAGAIDYLQGALSAAFPLGSGHGPVHHFYRFYGVAGG